MKTFEKHNVKYLSPSTINLFITQPALCLLKIAGYNDGEAGPPAWRGQAIDRAMCKVAFEPETSDEALLSIANQVYFEKQTQAENPHSEEKIAKEKASIKNYIQHGAKFYRDLGKQPIQEQGKVEIRIDDIDVPFFGYFDLLYDDEVRDTKSVGRAVSGLTASASRQASIYAVGTGREPWIDYVTPREVRSFCVQDVPYWIKQVEIASKGLEKILSFSDNTLECCTQLYPDYDHWMWTDTMKAVANDIWNNGETK